MSKERAIRRAAREAEAATARAARERAAARRARRRAVAQRIVPRRPDRRVGKLFPRRSRAERTFIVVLFALSVFVVWITVDDLATRIALTATLVIVAPAIVVLALGRR
jgi:hypothetical protein